MRTRQHEIVYQEAQTADKSAKSWDLDYKDPLSALYLEFEATNGTTSNKGNWLSDAITKVEVVSGSKPLVSLTGHELEALAFYKTRRAPALFPSEHASGIQRHGVHLLFGRYLYDELRALDCTKYQNPQLKVSWDLGAVSSVSPTIAFATGTLKLTAIAHLMEETPMPAKFLSAQEIDSFTMVTSGSHPTVMPVDFPWRLLMLRSYLRLKDIDECIDHLKLTFDGGKFIPLDNRYVKQLDAEALVEFGRCSFKHDVFVAHQIGFRELNNKENSSKAHVYEDSSGIICNVQYEWSSEGKLDLWTHGGVAVSSDTKITMKEDGHALHATVPIPFGRMADPESWLDATKFGKADLVLYAPTSGAAGVSSVVLEQDRPNGQ